MRTKQGIVYGFFDLDLINAKPKTRIMEQIKSTCEYIDESKRKLAGSELELFIKNREETIDTMEKCVNGEWNVRSAVPLLLQETERGIFLPKKWLREIQYEPEQFLLHLNALNLFKERSVASLSDELWVERMKKHLPEHYRNLEVLKVLRENMKLKMMLTD